MYEWFFCFIYTKLYVKFITIKKLIVHECNVPIKSIELQLVRVETCGCAEGYSKDCMIFISYKNEL